MPSIKRDATAVAAGMAETSKEPRIPVASRSGPRGCELDRLYLPYEWVLEELSCGTCADSRFVGEPHHCLQRARRVAEVVILFQNVVVEKAYRGEGMEAYYEAAAAQKRRRSVGGAAPVVSRAVKKEGPESVNVVSLKWVRWRSEMVRIKIASPLGPQRVGKSGVDSVTSRRTVLRRGAAASAGELLEEALPEELRISMEEEKPWCLRCTGIWLRGMQPKRNQSFSAEPCVWDELQS